MIKLNEIPEDHLPYWMRLAMRGTDWGILIVLGLALLSAWVFIITQDLPAAPYYESYVWRVEELSQNIQSGNIYPRWSYWAANGYGAPLYHFVPPGAAYVSAIITAIFTGDAVQGVRVFVMLVLCLGAGTTYSFLMRTTDAQAGLLGAILYLFNPFISSTLLLQTGNLDLLLGSALLPTILWSFHRFYSCQSMLNFALVAIIGAGLMLTSPLLSLGSFLLGLGLLWTSPDIDERWRLSLRIVYIGIFVLSLSAFFWLPALFELNTVSWIASIRQLQVETIQVSDIITLPRPIDTSLLFPQSQSTLGLWLPFLGIIALFISHTLPYKNNVRFFGFVAVGGIIGAIWQNQTEFLIFSVLGFSLAGAHSVCWQPLPHRINSLLFKRIGTTSLVIFTIIFAQATWTVLPRTQTMLTPSLENYMREIVTGGGEILIAPNRAMPTTITHHLQPTRDLVQEYLNGQNSHIASNRDNGLLMSLINSRGTTQRYQFRATSTGTITTQHAFFDGWQAIVNGRPITMGQDKATGLIQLQIMQTNNGELELSLHSTPLRIASWVIAGCMLILLLFRAWRQRHDSEFDIIKSTHYLDHKQIRLVLSGLVGIAVIVLLPNLTTNENRFPQKTDDTSLVNARPIDYRTEAGLNVVAYEISTTQIQAGETLGIRLWWQTARQLTDNLRTQVTLRNVNDNTINIQSELRHPAHYPTRRWTRGYHVLDTYSLNINDMLPAGRYTISVRVVECIDNCAVTQPLTFFDRQGTQLGTQFTIPQIITQTR